MAAAYRIYLVRSDDASVPERLVRAQNPAQVVAHIAKPLDIRVASQDDLVKALTSDVDVEETDGTAA